ncbi:MAG: Gfo/Idh/MocA family oxidoreductase [Methanothrix sp.]|nr:Gfo/Idh/MocA family oxidoreductase [Methanothrix sp.]MDD4517592.1 Gfo/Idh/MocA family oxidoreductase [Limnochordia bacterium]
MKKLGIGIVGYGFMGRVHLAAYMSIPVYYPTRTFEPVVMGVCSRSGASIKQAQQSHNFHFVTTDYAELLARDGIDVVDICTPNYLHKPMIIAALKANKHVYVDKPLALDAVEAEEILEVASRSSKKVQVGFQYRYIPAVMRAKQLIEQGAVGEVYHFHAAYLHAGYTDKDRPMSWRLRKSLAGGGALFDLGSHVVDLMAYLLGDFARVRASSQTFIKQRPSSEGSSVMESVDVDDYSMIEAIMEQGGRGVIEVSRFATGSNNDLSFSIYGSSGALRFNLMEPNWLYYYNAALPGDPYGGLRGYSRIECVNRYDDSDFPGPKHEIGWMRYHIAAQYAFLTSIALGTSPSPGVAEAYHVQQVLSAAARSVSQGCWENV